MKKWMLVIVIGILILLSGCSSPINITEGQIDVIFDNPRYEGTSIVVDVWITNGTDESYDIDTVDFWFEIPEGIELGDITDVEVCGSNFELFDRVNPDDYLEYEIEFTSTYIFITESELEELGLTLDDLEFYYLFI